MATHDNLTGLASRLLCMNHLKLSIAAAKRTQTNTGIFFIDLDDFKKVNDQCGHDVGDKLLIEVSQRIQSSVREMDTVGRLGGDEFLIIATNMTSRSDAIQIADSLMDALLKPFKVCDQDIRINISVGISLYPDHTEDSEDLVKLADQAMYQSKRKGKNCYSFYS